MKKFLAALIALLVGLIAGTFVGEKMGKAQERSRSASAVVSDTIVVTDTVSIAAPTAEKTVALGSKTYKAAVSGGGDGGLARCSSGEKIVSDSCGKGSLAMLTGTGAGGEPRCISRGDSVTVDLPVIQRYYSDSTYEAWVSGPIEPQLDSIRVISRTVTVKEYQPPNRWSVGVMCGAGLGTKGVQPFIGIGISYAIFSF